MSHIIDQNARPVIFGECLYDHYPDGNKLLAGAPLTVAWHLHGFGLRPLLITRIGQDTEGELALAAMHQWGLDTRGIQIDPQHPTGSVLLSNNQGENHFEIKPNQAWDYIGGHLALEWIKTLPCSLLYAGSLAQRHHVSHKTLQRLLLEGNLPLFVDINIREPWNDALIIEQSLEEAHWLKINDVELHDLTKTKNLSTQQINDAAKELKSKHDIETIYITRGSKGSISINENGNAIEQSNSSIDIVDTVGAGDAFTALSILGIHKGWNQKQIIHRANQFAERICQIQGATSLMKKDYIKYLEEWI